jgi:hypothetical protein
MTYLKVYFKMIVILIKDKLFFFGAYRALYMIHLEMIGHRIFVIQGFITIHTKWVEENYISILILVSGF